MVSQMSRTGHYEWNGITFVKVDDSARIKPSCYFNKGNVPQWDPSARVMFQSKEHKRQWQDKYHMKEGGIIRKRDEDRIVSRCKMSKV